jgi:hypothetical protein
VFAGAVWFLIKSRSKKELGKNAEKAIEQLLETEVDFFRQIPAGTTKDIFRDRVIRFMQQVRFTSVGKASHTLLDEVMIAVSAIIPLYNFPDWEYRNIREVILYDDHFDSNYQVSNDKHIMGMVGEGNLNNTMVLSLRALREGFAKKDGNNTAMHEFVHLIDKADGMIDGVPEYLIPSSLIEPWVKQVHNMIMQIHQHDSQINPYAATNDAEFLAVISEYFFEKPAMLSREHPELYAMLKKIFSPEEESKVNEG